MKIKRVTVVGAGIMGSGISYLCAWRGYEVTVREINEKTLRKGIGKIREMIVRGVEKGKITQGEAEETLGRINGTTDLNKAVKNAEIVIEATFEDFKGKKELFNKLDDVSPPYTILASNTSALSISAIASATKRPDKVIGLHFFNPVYNTKLVEVIVGKYTSKETQKLVSSFVVSLGKEFVLVKDTPGFIVSRILISTLTEAILILQEGIASAEDIDKAMILSLNWPIGPFKLTDFIGLDLVLAVNRIMFQALGENYKPPSLLEEKVRAGHLGIKSGKGFYKYKSERSKRVCNTKL